MRKRLVLASAALLFAGRARAADAPKHLQDVPRQVERGGMFQRDDRVDGSGFDLEIVRLAKEDGATLLDVRVKNVSDITLEAVELSCTVFDESDREIGFERAQEIAAAAPGTSVKVMMKIPSRGEARAATCNARGW